MSSIFGRRNNSRVKSKEELLRDDTLKLMIGAMVNGEDGEDSITGVLAVYTNLIPDSTAALACFTSSNSPSLIGKSGSMNADHFLALQADLKRLCSGINDTKVSTLEKLDIDGRMIRYDGAEHIHVVFLGAQDDVYGILLVEEYGKSSTLSMELLEPIHNLLTIYVRSFVFLQNQEAALKMDSVTNLFGQETLTDKLRYLVDAMSDEIDDRLTLAVYKVSDMVRISLESDYVSVVTRVVDVLKEDADWVYRITNSRFACIYRKDYFDTGAILKCVRERIANMSPPIQDCSVTYTPVKDSADDAIAACDLRLSVLPEGAMEFVHNAGDGLYEYSGCNDGVFVELTDIDDEKPEDGGGTDDVEDIPYSDSEIFNDTGIEPEVDTVNDEVSETEDGSTETEEVSKVESDKTEKADKQSNTESDKSKLITDEIEDIFSDESNGFFSDIEI